MRQFGSQIRETLKEAKARIIKRIDDNTVLLVTPDTPEGYLELWIKRDDYSGHVIEIDGHGYEFINTNLPL